MFLESLRGTDSCANIWKHITLSELRTVSLDGTGKIYSKLPCCDAAGSLQIHFPTCLMARVYTEARTHFYFAWLSTPTAGFSSAAEWNTLWENHPMLIFRASRNEQSSSLCSPGWTRAFFSPRLSEKPVTYKQSRLVTKYRKFLESSEYALQLESRTLLSLLRHNAPWLQWMSCMREDSGICFLKKINVVNC